MTNLFFYADHVGSKTVNTVSLNPKPSHFCLFLPSAIEAHISQYFSGYFLCKMSQGNANIESSELDDSEYDSTECAGPDWYRPEELDEFDQKLLEQGSERAYYFESDHAALKGNQDYYDLVKTMAILQSQRIKAIEV